MRRYKKRKPRQVSEEYRLKELASAIAREQSSLDSLHSTIREFPQALEEWKKKLAELEPEHHPDFEKARGRIAELSQWIQKWEAEKAAVAAREKNLPPRAEWNRIYKYSHQWPEAVRKTVELDLTIAMAKDQQYMAMERLTPEFHGYLLDDRGFEKLQQDEQRHAGMLAYLKTGHAKLAAVLRDKENKLRPSMGLTMIPLPRPQPISARRRT